MDKKEKAKIIAVNVIEIGCYSTITFVGIGAISSLVATGGIDLETSLGFLKASVIPASLTTLVLASISSYSEIKLRKLSRNEAAINDLDNRYEKLKGSIEKLECLEGEIKDLSKENSKALKKAREDYEVLGSIKKSVLKYHKK